MARLLNAIVPNAVAAVLPAAAIFLCAATVAPATKTVSCIQTSRIRSIESIDSQTARVTLWNRAVYLNKFRRECPVAGFKGFAYKSPTGQLCSGNTVRAVGTGNASTCILGKFEEVPQAAH